MTSRYLRKHYKKEDVLSYSHLLKGIYRFLFEEFSFSGILRNIQEKLRESGTFKITAKKKKKAAYFSLSCLFHLICFFILNFYYQHHISPPRVIAQRSFDQSAIQLVDISPAMLKEIKTSGGKPKDTPQEKTNQGIPQEMVRMARADKPVLAPPTPKKFLNKIFRRAINTRRLSRTQKLPNTQTRKVELARAEQTKDMPSVKRNIKTNIAVASRKATPVKKRIPEKKPIGKPAPEKQLSSPVKQIPQQVIKKKTPAIKPADIKPAQPAIDQQRKIAKLMERAETQRETKVPIPRKLEVKKAALQMPEGKKLVYTSQAKKTIKPVRQKPARSIPASQKTVTQKITKKTVALIKPEESKPAKPVIDQERKMAKAIIEAETKVKVTVPVPRKIDMIKAVSKAPEGKKLVYEPARKKMVRQSVKLPEPAFKNPPQQTEKNPFAVPETHRIEAAIPKIQVPDFPASPNRQAPKQDKERTDVAAVLPSRKARQKARAVNMGKQEKGQTTAIKRLEYDEKIIQQVRKVQALPQAVPIKALPINPRAVPIAKPVQKADTRTVTKTALMPPSLSPQPAKKALPSSPLLLAETGDKTFTIALTQKSKTTAKVGIDAQASRTYYPPSSRQIHVPEKLDELEELLKLSPTLGQASSVSRKKIKVKRKTSFSKKAKNTKIEEGLKREREKEVQYTQNRRPRTKEQQKKLTYEKSSVSPDRPVTERVNIVDSKTSVASRSVPGPENLSQKTTTLLEPVVARDHLAEVSRTITPQKAVEEFPLVRKDFTLPVDLTPAPDKALQVAARFTSNPTEALVEKNIEYSKISPPQRKKHQFRLQYKSQSTLKAGRDITAPEMSAKEPTLSAVPAKQILPAIQQATKLEMAFEKNNLVSLNREKTHLPSGPSHEKRDKILRDASELDKTRSEAAKIRAVAIISHKSTERPVKLRTKKIPYQQEQEKSIHQFEGDLREPSLIMADREQATVEQAARKSVPVVTFSEIRQPLGQNRIEDLLVTEKKISPIRGIQREVEPLEKSFAYSEYRPTTVLTETKKQMVQETGIQKSAKVIEAFDQPVFDVSAPAEAVTTATRTAKQRKVIERIQGKLSSLITKGPDMAPAEREFVPANQVKTEETPEEKILGFQEKGIESVEIRQERLAYQNPRTHIARQSTAEPDSIGLEDPQIKERRGQSLSGVEKKVTEVIAGTDLPTPTENQEITPEQEIARELLVAQLTEEMIQTEVFRKIIEEKSLEYAAAQSAGTMEPLKKVQYAQQTPGKDKKPTPQDLPEVSIEVAPSDRTHVTQAQRAEQREQDIDLGEVKRVVTLYIEKALEKGFIENAGAGTLREAQLPHQLGYQARTNGLAGISQERVVYEQQSDTPQERLGQGPEQLDSEIFEIMAEEKGIDTFERAERAQTSLYKEDKIPTMADDFHSRSVPLARVEKESSDAILGDSQVRTPAIEKEFQYEERKETHDTVKMQQKRVSYKNLSDRTGERATASPESIVSQAEQYKELSGEMESRSTNNLASIAKKTFSYKEQIDTPVLHSAALGKVDTPKSSIQKQVLDKILSSLTTPEKTLQKKRMAMVNRKKIDSIPVIKQGEQEKKIMNSPVAPTRKEEKRNPLITIERPESNMTSQPLYTLMGNIDQDVKLLFVTVNEVTQMVPVLKGEFKAKLSMAQGINQIDIMGYNSSGGIGQLSTKILFKPRISIPVVRLLSPPNGLQGIMEGDAVVVRGTVGDPRITQATLFLNNVPIKIKIENGSFRRKIFIPRGRVITFRVMATNQEGGVGYSPIHTLLSGYETDIFNPRPY